MFLRNAWYAAIWSEGLARGTLVPRTILGEPIVFFRKEDGHVAALTDLCPHKFAPLHMGKLVAGDRVMCGYHGLEFDPSGACVRNPHGSERIPATCRVKSYAVHELHSMVWIWMGDKGSDVSTIPDYSFMDENSGYDITKRDFIRIEANYRMVADNLMDLSHSPFLHDGVIGGPDTIKADIKVEQVGNIVKVHRPKKNVRPPGLLDRLYRQDGARVDIWSTIRWTPPCYILNDVGAHPVDGDRSDGSGIFGAHLLTPETEHTTLYHFSAARTGLIADQDEDQAEFRQWLSDARRHAFEKQDEPMIEAQSSMRRQFPDVTNKPVLLEIDAGPVRCNKVLSEMIEKERGVLPIHVAATLEKAQ
ncbi:aromatic ring-hydroxylating dioxygenase subunit alpha [soil metagenome]